MISNTQTTYKKNIILKLSSFSFILLNLASCNIENNSNTPKLDHSSTLKGIDKNNNGIRDDIDLYLIDKKLSNTQLKTTQQYARVLQEMITVNLNNQSAIDKIETKATNTTQCLFDNLDMNAIPLITELEMLTANTKQRLQAYLLYNKKQNGTVVRLLDYNTCE